VTGKGRPMNLLLPRFGLGRGAIEPGKKTRPVPNALNKIWPEELLLKKRGKSCYPRPGRGNGGLLEKNLAVRFGK